MTSPVLELRQISVAFGRARILHDLDLTVPAGEIYGFLGRNGAGKTTTLRVITGIIAPSAGSIVFAGQTTIRTTAHMRQDIGYVAQEQHFYDSMTARQLGWFVGAFYPKWDGALFHALLARLDVPKDQRAGQLSGGTRIKLALALALAPRPGLLVLDEPTSGIDPITRREIFEILRAESGPGGQSVSPDVAVPSTDVLAAIGDVRDFRTGSAGQRGAWHRYPVAASRRSRTAPCVYRDRVRRRPRLDGADRRARGAADRRDVRRCARDRAVVRRAGPRLPPLRRDGRRRRRRSAARRARHHRRARPGAGARRPVARR